MKKTILLFALAVITYSSTSAQSNAAEYLDINNVKARFMVHGDMFWDPVTGTPSYEFPKGSGKHSNHTSSIWIGGIDKATNQLKIAAQTYRQTGNDYWPGPLDGSNGGTITSATSANWAKIWKINKSTIDSFRQLATHTLANTPSSILQWPGRNANSTNGAQQVMGAVSGLLNIPDRPMAPFIDVNNDNVYNPLDGDYPDIKGDQMLFWVFNDKANPKTNSGSATLDIEVHGSAYACTKAGLENTTFVNFKFLNFSSSILDSTYVGLWNDGDLGFAFDDYIGYDSSYKMAVYYNGDPFDEGALGYGSNLTQTGIIMLKGPLVDSPKIGCIGNNLVELPPSGFSYFDNTPSTKTGSPTNAAEYYNYLTGSWKDGTQIMEGCNPAATTGTQSSFVFPGDPSAPSGVSELVCNKVPGDRKTLISFGPFELIPGDIKDITFAVINTDTGTSNANFNELRRLADSAYKYVDGCGGVLWPLGVPNITKSKLKVYPNPASGFFIVEDPESKLKKIDLYNSYGQVIYKVESEEIKTTIDTRSLTKGIYFLQVQRDGERFAQKILIE